MTLRVYNHKTFYENIDNLPADTTTGFIMLNTDDENLIRDLINIDKQYSTVVGVGANTGQVIVY